MQTQNDADDLKTAREEWSRAQYDAAFFRLQRLARRGVVEAYLNIGTIYELGLGSREKSLERAVLWYGKAADEGQVGGVLALARLHMEGLGVHRDYELARMYYQDVVDATQDRRALFGLAIIHHNGLGVPIDLGEAEQLYLRAKKAGHLVAPRYLAHLYWSEGKYAKASFHWIRAVLRIWKIAFTAPESHRLHEQL